ncbi:MAG: PQQ-dependent sugar dehydrogenase, partial [Methylophilus sp.]
MLQPAAQAGEGVVPRLLLSGSDAAEADKEANKEPEPPRISSVFGTQNLKVYKLPFEDSYPSGPFERLDKHLFLFISKCGDVYFVRQNETLELVKPG